MVVLATLATATGMLLLTLVSLLAVPYIKNLKVKKQKQTQNHPPAPSLSLSTCLHSHLIPHCSDRLLQVRKDVIRLPGPPVRSYILGNVLDFPSDPVLKTKFLIEDLDKYSGDSGVVRIFLGPTPLLHVSGLKYVRELLATSRHIDRTVFYDNMKPWLGLGVLTAEGERWKHARRLITPAFHFEVLHRFTDVMNEHAESLLNRIDANADGLTRFDAFPLITDCTLDIICETAMGKRIGVQTGDSEHQPYIRAVAEMARSVVTRVENPLYANDFIYSLTPEGRRDKARIKILHGFANRVIEERKADTQDSAAFEEHQPKRRPAFLDILLKAQADGENLSDENIREEVDTFMVAGHETTAISLVWALQLLGRHPEVQESLYGEIVEVMGDSKDLTKEMFGQFRYLEMVLRECMRVYCTVPMLGRKLTEDVVFEGVTVPAGTMATVNIHAIHHNPRLWPDPEKFDPERWTPENMEGRDPYQYIPFAAGPRNWSAPPISFFSCFWEIANFFFFFFFLV